MALSRADIGKLLRPGLRTVFGLNYRDIALERDQVFESRTSTKAYEEDQNIWGTGYAVEIAEGQSVSFDDVGQGWTARYVHKKVGLALRLREEAMDDDQYVKWGSRGAKSLARSLRLKQDLDSINVLNNADSSSYLGGDGKALAATDHPLSGPGGGTYSNMLSTPQDISEAALIELTLLMRYAVDDRGLPIRLTIKRLFCSAALEFDFARLLKSTGRTGTADHDINPIKDSSEFNTPALLQLLTETSAWGFTTEGTEGGLIHFDRRAVRATNKDEFSTGDHLMKIDCRYSDGWTDPRGAYFGLT
jgi:hypothetical protein